MKPVIIVGAGPVGLTTALALAFHGVPFAVFEEDGALSVHAKAGTVLTRTLEAFRRYGVADAVLAGALRVDEICEIERGTNETLLSVHTAALADETRFPFVINLPQHHLEPVLARALEEGQPGAMRLQHRLTAFTETDGGITAVFETPDGSVEIEGSYLLACDGGRSTVRGRLDIPVEGTSLDVRYMLADVAIDLDQDTPRDYPYLAYYADPQEWMVLVRQPHCWRFVFPLPPGQDLPTPDAFCGKVRGFLGAAPPMEVLHLVAYNVHHRIATRWRDGKVFLLGDAAHLITPMWALGMNSGILDALSLSWRLAWVARGMASPDLLDGYEREQRPLCVHGSAELAEAARAFLDGERDRETGMSADNWNNAMTRTLLGVRLDVDGSGHSAVVRTGGTALRVGERIPDALLHGPDGRPVRLHDLVDDSFLALYFTDVRRHPAVPQHTRGLRHYAVSRWDAPLDSGLRDRSLFDAGGRLQTRIGCGDGHIVLVRPDDHVAAIVPLAPGVVERLLGSILWL